MKTTFKKNLNKADKKWYIIDAKDKVLGKVAVEAAKLLRGKHNVDYVPHLDDGDYVIVINAAHYRVTGQKLDQKKYYRHSGKLGNLKEIPLKRMQEKHPLKAMQAAIAGMIPANRLKKPIMSKLKLFADAEHEHESQKPIELKIS